jgi:hypothetical protein
MRQLYPILLRESTRGVRIADMAENQTIPDPPQGNLRRYLADAALASIIALVFGAIVASLALAGVNTMTAALTALVIAFILIMVATFAFDHLWRPAWKHKFGVALGSLALLGLIGWYEWRNFSPPLTKEDIASFIAHPPTPEPVPTPASALTHKIDTYSLFIRTHSLNKDLGEPTTVAISTPLKGGGLYQASFDYGAAFWISALNDNFILYDKDKDWTRIVDRTKDDVWVDNKEAVRVRLQIPPSGAVHQGAIARFYAADPTARKRLGQTNWTCLLNGDYVFVQNFEHGTVFGPVRTDKDNTNNVAQIVVLKDIGKKWDYAPAVDEAAVPRVAPKCNEPVWNWRQHT